MKSYFQSIIRFCTLFGSLTLFSATVFATPSMSYIPTTLSKPSTSKKRGGIAGGGNEATRSDLPSYLTSKAPLDSTNSNGSITAGFIDEDSSAEIKTREVEQELRNEVLDDMKRTLREREDLQREAYDRFELEINKLRDGKRKVLILESPSLLWMPMVMSMVLKP